ncbi:MAG: hypothetical protein FWG60_00085 [Methanomassiliicoccaceae archaeon]|nr:hypothetical protein [Methanomassiliicoccaceae archaeon]
MTKAHTGIRLPIISAIPMAVSLIISLAVYDYMWAIVSAVGITALLIPRLTKGKGLSYHRSLLLVSLIPFTLYIVLFAANVIVGVEAYRYISLMIQPLASVVCAYMLLVSVDANSGTVLSKRWIFVFSVAFTCTLAVLYVFFLFYAMQDLGYPLYNWQFEGPDALDNTDANHYFMLPINLAVIFSLAYGLLIDRYLRGVEAKDLTRYYGREDN